MVIIILVHDYNGTKLRQIDTRAEVFCLATAPYNYRFSKLVAGTKSLKIWDFD